MVVLPRIACEPPIGETTTITSTIADFFVALDWSPLCKLDAATYEVALWHNGGENRQWTETILARIEPLSLHSSTLQYFFGKLPRPLKSHSVHFTLKIRLEGAHWQWLNDIDPQKDGEVIFQSDAQVLSLGLSDLFHDLDPCWDVEHLPAGETSLKIWALSSAVIAANDKECGLSHICLGVPKAVSRWFALVRHSTPWLGPRQGTTQFNPDKPAILASFLREDGMHLVILALNGASDVLTTFAGASNGHIVVSACNDSPQPSQASLYVALSPFLETAVECLMDNARARVSAQCGTISNQGSILSSPSDTSDKPLEKWRDGFSYCTWNGVGQTLNEDKILHALESLALHDIDITNLIIDDNWQSVDFEGDSNFNYRWTDFDANIENFPAGLKHTIQRLRKQHPYIQHVAVWHGIFGYWNGVSPTGSIAGQYKTKQVTKSGREGYMGSGPIVTVAADDVHRLYDDFYGFLTSAGVDSVKADVQFYPDYLQDAPDRRAMMYVYQDAWTAAAQKHFQGRAISCMSMTPQILFHSLLLKDKPRYMARNSDDFFPFDPSSHTWHIFTNAHNALLTQHLNILPDWDMFQTVHEFGGMHAAARCLSGGPIYITDTPGQHDIKLIKQMTAKSIAGRSIVLRPMSLGTTMEAYVQPHSNRFLRIGTTHLQHSLLGVFNIGERTRTELVKLSSFRALHENRIYIVRKHSNGVIFGPFDTTHQLPIIPVQLDPKGYEILTANPCWTVDGNITAAILGLLGKMSGACATTSHRHHIGGDSKKTLYLTTGCKAVGTMGLYLSRAREFLQTDRVRAHLRIGDDQHPTRIAASNETENVLEIDTEQAWSVLAVGRNIGDAREAVLVVRIDVSH